MSLRDTAPAQSSESSDESYKRLIPSNGSGIEVPDLPSGALEGPRLYFRLSTADEKSIKHGMKFWLKTGVAKTDGTMISVPFVSPNDFADFMISGRRGMYVGRSAAAKGCPLSKLADQRHPVVALNTLRKDDQGNFRPNVDPFHTAHVQLVKLVRDGQGKVIVENGKPRIEVQPEGLGFEFRQNWWEQMVNLLEPLPFDASAVVDDGMTDAAPAAPPKDLKAFMTANGVKDMTRVIFYIVKKKRTKNPTGDVKKDVDYELSFSDKVWITDAQDVKAVDPLDWAKVYKSPTQDELNVLIAKAENRNLTAGAAVPAPVAGAPAPGAPSADAPAAYLGTATVPLDGAGPAMGAAATAQPTGDGPW